MHTHDFFLYTLTTSKNLIMVVSDNKDYYSQKTKLAVNYWVYQFLVNIKLRNLNINNFFVINLKFVKFYQNTQKIHPLCVL